MENIDVSDKSSIMKLDLGCKRIRKDNACKCHSKVRKITGSLKC